MLKKTCLFVGWVICVSHMVAAQQSRLIQPFTDHWEFTKDTSTASWQAITLPHTYNNADMQLGRNFYAGDAFYKKVFTIPSSLAGQRIFLRFEGVGSVADVYINGKYLTRHKGSYSAFAFEVTHVLNYDKENTILVKTNNEARKDVLPVNHFLFPIYGGIYRPVTMIVTAPVGITVTDYASPGVTVFQDSVSATKAAIRVSIKLENKEKLAKNILLKTVIADDKGKTVASAEKKINVLPQGQTRGIINLKVDRPHLWDGVRDPYLYTLKALVMEDGNVIDEVVQPLGLRHIELRPMDGVYLNGKKYPMYGVTRHQDRWEYGNALSPAQELEDMLLIKEMGATTIRLAHYQQSENIYRLADSLGLLVWAEIPFVNTFSTQEEDNAVQQLTELIRQNMHHASIYIWGLHNEVYSKTPDDYVAVLTRRLNDLAKTEDPTRPTGAVSGYGEMNRPANLAADVQGMNRYYGWYEGRMDDLDQWAQKMASAYPSYKLMLTEYGADGNIDQSSDTLPSVKSIDPVNGQFSPENYQTETHIRQWAIIEKHPNILASYLWNTFEFATPMWNRGGVNARNLKGLITFDRKRKKDAYYWYKANWNSDPMIYLANRRDSVRTKKENTVQVFSNLDNIRLKVNGKWVTGKKGVNNRHFLFDIVLKKGKNKIVATAINGKQTYSDEMIWYSAK